MIKSSFLPDVAAETAIKLTGIKRTAAILSKLSRDHYFTEKRSNTSPIYQYHPLFREFLLSKASAILDLQEFTSIKKEAAVLVEESGRPEDAAALFRETGDWEGYVRVVMNNAQSLLSQGRFRTMLNG